MSKEYSKKYYNKINFRKDFSFPERIFLKLNEKTSIFSNYYYHLIKVVNKVPLNGTILDVGIASGTFSNFIHRLRPDIKIYGLDITNIKDILPEYIIFIQDDATNFNLNKKFDLIFSNHLLEHLEISSVPKVLECINKHIKKNGIFWFTVPTLSNSFYSDPTHIRPYNKEAMTRLLSMTNYKALKVFEEYYFKFPFSLIKKIKLKISFGYAKIQK